MKRTPSAWHCANGGRDEGRDVLATPQRVLSVCAGIGGLDLAVERALAGAVRVVAYVERDIAACEILAARMADGRLQVGPIWTDVHTFPADRFRGLVDGVIGGYPCQPFSHAGQRRGHEDERHLWPAIARLVRAVEPRWCLFENVSGHLSLGGREVFRELQAMGYRTAAVLATASEVGAPHKRERLFILAVTGRLISDKGNEHNKAGCEPDSVSGSDLSLWPPGPADAAGWQWVLERWPDLTPAVADA